MKSFERQEYQTENTDPPSTERNQDTEVLGRDDAGAQEQVDAFKKDEALEEVENGLRAAEEGLEKLKTSIQLWEDLRPIKEAASNYEKSYHYCIDLGGKPPFSYRSNYYEGELATINNKLEKLGTPKLWEFDNKKQVKELHAQKENVELALEHLTAVRGRIDDAVAEFAKAHPEEATDFGSTRLRTFQISDIDTALLEERTRAGELMYRIADLKTRKAEITK
jgi:hypothetical protein